MSEKTASLYSSGYSPARRTWSDCHFEVSEHHGVPECWLMLVDQHNNRVPRPVILTFVGWYLPGYKAGGPIRTVNNMVDRLHDVYTFQVVTADRDHGESQPYVGIAADQWSSVGHAEVYYASRRGQTMRRFRRLILRTPHDVMYLNSLFNPRFTLLPLLIRRLGVAPIRPTVLAPRGELGSGALALKSVKKRLFLLVARRVGLYRNLYWQASSEHEATRISQVMGAAPSRVFVAPNLPGMAAGNVLSGRAPRRGRLTVVFLSRIAPMKNLDYALRVLSRVSSPLDFLVYGTIEDAAYWGECQRLMAQIPGHIRIEYRGALTHDRVPNVLAAADLFFLPTRGENYGHAIVEALGAGLPVLISDQTPWGDVQDRGAGWALSLENPAAFAEAVDAFARESPERRAIRADNAYEYGREVTDAVDAIDANVRMFRRVLSSDE